MRYLDLFKSSLKSALDREYFLDRWISQNSDMDSSSVASCTSTSLSSDSQMDWHNGFDPEGPVQNAPPGFEVANRRPWGYYQMIRFWITRIWEHDAIQRFDVIMRMDSDSCFTEPNEYLPQMLHNHLVYQSQYVGTEPPPGRPYIEGLYDFATNYLAKNNKLPGNSLLWQFIQTTWNSQNTLPLFRTNFEIVKRNFMQRPDVKQWHMALTEGEPYGVLRYRWGDAVIRFFDAAIFASDETTLTIKPDGYNHKQHCTWPEV